MHRAPAIAGSGCASRPGCTLHRLRPRCSGPRLCGTRQDLPARPPALAPRLAHRLRAPAAPSCRVCITPRTPTTIRRHAGGLRPCPRPRQGRAFVVVGQPQKSGGSSGDWGRSATGQKMHLIGPPALLGQRLHAFESPPCRRLPDTPAQSRPWALSKAVAPISVAWSFWRAKRAAMMMPGAPLGKKQQGGFGNVPGQYRWEWPRSARPETHAPPVARARLDTATVAAVRSASHSACFRRHRAYRSRELCLTCTSRGTGPAGWQ